MGWGLVKQERDGVWMGGKEYLGITMCYSHGCPHKWEMDRWSRGCRGTLKGKKVTSVINSPPWSQGMGTSGP